MQFNLHLCKACKVCVCYVFEVRKTHAYDSRWLTQDNCLMRMRERHDRCTQGYSITTEQQNKVLERQQRKQKEN